MTDKKQPENEEYFDCLDTMTTNDVRCIREIKSTIAMANAALNKKVLFTSKLYLNLTKKLANCYIWNIDEEEDNNSYRITLMKRKNTGN
jgi:hypothetical protein